MITAQYKDRPSTLFLPGVLPGTTTEYGGILPKIIFPVFLSIILVDCPIKTPIERTDPSPTITHSTTSERAPIKQLSSIMVGFACMGSSTPPIPAPPEI